jgi:branched-chain amino acid transport system substrate-binding protein
MMKLRRRTVLKGLAGAGVAATLKAPYVHAQGAALKVGLICDKTGGLAEGGIQMEQGLTSFLKSKNMMIAGRKVDFIVADSASNPAGAKTKAQELIERDGIDVINGPLAAFELLAISDYVASKKTPMLSLAAAEDVTQRKPNPYLLRASATSSQCMHPLADYAAKEMKLKKVVCIADDFAFGYEQMGGFQRVFEGAGGQVVKRIYSPLVTADYTPYLAQIDDMAKSGAIDAVVHGFAAANPVKFMKQYHDAGLKLPVLGGETAADDALLPHFGDEAIGVISASPYTADLKTKSNEEFLAAMKKNYNVAAGQYAAIMWLNGMVIEEAVKKLGGKTDDKDAFIKALRAVELSDTPRGPVKFDHFGNISSDVFVRRCEKKGGQLVNTTIKTYPNVSQFWTFDEKTFLSQPVYSRDYPPLKT